MFTLRYNKIRLKKSGSASTLGVAMHRLQRRSRQLGKTRENFLLVSAHFRLGFFAVLGHRVLCVSSVHGKSICVVIVRVYIMPGRACSAVNCSNSDNKCGKQKMFHRYETLFLFPIPNQDVYFPRYPSDEARKKPGFPR